MLVRSAMHQAGASALTELLRFPAPDQRAIPCPCGQQARYRELRSKTVLTAVGTVEVSRPYYLCPHCHEGQFPADQELDIVDTEFSPGVRRMQALVGQATAVRSRSRADETAGRPGGHHQVSGTRGRSHRRGYRAAGAARDRSRRATRSADHCRRTRAHFVCADGRHRRACGEEGNRGPQRQTRWLACPYARGQARLRVHANHLG